MNTITKEMFLQQKINNFIIFIDQKIGKDNSIYREFCTYKSDLNLFLQNMIQLSAYANKETKEFSHEAIEKFLEYKGITKKIENEDFIKINRYFNMFIKIIES